MPEKRKKLDLNSSGEIQQLIAKRKKACTDYEVEMENMGKMLQKLTRKVDLNTDENRKLLLAEKREEIWQTERPKRERYSL